MRYNRLVSHKMPAVCVVRKIIFFLLISAFVRLRSGTSTSSVGWNSLLGCSKNIFCWIIRTIFFSDYFCVKELWCKCFFRTCIFFIQFELWWFFLKNIAHCHWCACLYVSLCAIVTYILFDSYIIPLSSLSFESRTDRHIHSQWYIE